MARLIRRPVRPMWPHRKIDKSPFVEPRVGNPTDGATSIPLPFVRGPLERSASCGTRSNTLGKRRRTAPRGLRMPPIPIFVSSSSGCVIRGSVRRTALNLLPAWISISTRWSAVRREFLVIEPKPDEDEFGIGPAPPSATARAPLRDDRLRGQPCAIVRL
jgi:hypothetical protein